MSDAGGGPLAGLAAALSDRYRIERELGMGGMATVYLARDIKHDRQVAIKVLRPDLAAALGAERFLAEIRTTANLQHPNILPLFDSGGVTVGHPERSEGPQSFLYYVMPFIDGESLRDKLARERQLDIAESLEITKQVASALAYAHERGIVHRDIKPENILLSGGHAVVADFGISRAIGVAGGQQLTATGTAIGTPAYMSPEQSAGMSDIDGRSDTYSLASVLYEMLTGEPPYTGATAAAIIAKRLGTTAPSARVLRNTVPKAVDLALQRAMQRAPSDRFATATEFAAALQPGSRPSSIAVPRRLVVAAIAVFVIAAAAWFGLRGRGGSAALDPDVIAVVPFRVGGPSTSYLRESMLDLLQARLSSGAGSRTVEPRTLLAAWRRRVSDEKDDLSADASRQLARELGAGRVLLGSAIATPTELTISGTLIRVADGKVLAEEKSVGAPDSVAVLVNRLTAALLIRDAGESRERSTGLAAAPLDALQDYLAGRKAYRRGDYFTAMQLYGRALERDSTFVEPAYSMVATNAWIGTVVTTAGYAVIPRVWQMRDRLNARDRALFLALPLVGPNFPAPSTYREIIAQAERAAKLAPDSPEAWTLLGQLHSYDGAMASETDWGTQAADALDRAIALDSTFATALQARLFTALRAGDTAATRRLARLDAGLASGGATSGFFDPVYLWAAAHSLRDSTAARHWREQTNSLSHNDYISKLTVIALQSAAMAQPLDDATWAVATLRKAATSDTDRIGLGLAEYAVRFAAGRSDIHDLVGLIDHTGPGWASTMVEHALFEPAYRSTAAQLIAEERQGSIGTPSVHGLVRWPPFQDCFVSLFRMESGDTTNVRAAIRRLTDFTVAGGREAASRSMHEIDLRVCPLTLEALLESRSIGGKAHPALDRLDSLMHDGPEWYSGDVDISPTAFANYVVARLRAAQGEYPAALAAIRRREVNLFPAFTWSLPAFLRQEGRLAALAGDTAGAIRAYDQYLTLRTAPDPPFKPQRDSVLAERAALRPRS